MSTTPVGRRSPALPATRPSGIALPLALIIGLFFLWGVANNLNDVLIPHFKKASSFLVMSIIGGAALTALMGLVSDLSNIRIAMLVPVVCFAVVAWFGLTERSARSTFSTPRPHSQSTSP